jgi:CHAT domain-containing protein/Tfp pilus assembly protein PilF
VNSQGNRITKHFCRLFRSSFAPQTGYEEDVNYLASIGLLVLLGLSAQVFINPNLQTNPHTNNDPSAVLLDDPERLFVEAMKLAETGDLGDVNKRVDEACLLWIRRGDPERAGRARLQIGDLYRNDKRFDESLSQYRQTLMIERLSPALKALTYDSIGQIYVELYQTELAQRNYSKALSLARANRDYLVEADVQLNLATLSFKNGDLRRAMEIAQSAVSSSSKGNDEKVLALSLGFLAQMELKNGQIEKGRSDLDRALSLYRQNDDQPAQIKILCFLSGLSLSARQVSQAKEQAESALRMAEDLARSASSNSQKLRANALRWPCWLALARAQRASQQREEALKSYFRAVSGTVVDWWRVYASTETSAIGFSEERQAPYRELIDLLVELERVNEAYDAYQYARVRTLSGLISARHPVGFRSGSDADNKIRELSASIASLRTRLLSPTLNRSQRENLQQELVEVEDDLAERRLHAELNHPKRRMVFSKPAALKQLQNQVLGDGESVLEVCLGEERSFAWLISRETVGFEILPGRREIEDKVRQYVNDLSVAPANLYLQSKIAKQRGQAAELFTMLFGKLANQLRADSKLIVIPDGLLNQLPFESLVHNGRYLIEDHQISYLPSASLIELLRQPPKPASDIDDQLDLLAFGDPVFQQQSKPSLSRKLPATPSEINRQTGDWDRTKLLRLPRTRDEVEYIASLIPKEQQRLYLGKDSTEKAFKQESLSKYKWIHFATHSLIDERTPGRSAVVLALDGNNAEDGFLRTTEIADLDLNCDLVVLSACETGRGQLLSGEGIIGLSRSFFIAGARSVLVSQWAVSDISTAQLMKDFYQQLVNKVPKAAALREAKLRMLNGGSETRHPYYWAPFVIIGAP